MKKSYQIYVKSNVDLTKYGFVETKEGWCWRDRSIRTALCVEKATRRLNPFLGYSTKTIAVIIAMAEDKALIVDKGDYAPYVMHLTYEEMVAVNKMRGHPEPVEPSK